MDKGFIQPEVGGLPLPSRDLILLFLLIFFCKKNESHNSYASTESNSELCMSLELDTIQAGLRFSKYKSQVIIGKEKNPKYQLSDS